MSRQDIHLSEIKPLSGIRLRTIGAYEGTITLPGDLVSDGKIIFDLRAVPEDSMKIARDLASTKQSASISISQEKAQVAFDQARRKASKKAELLGQISDAPWLPSLRRDSVAVLSYGRQPNKQGILVDAHRLLLLKKVLQFDEMRCSTSRAPVLLKREGKPVGIITALGIDVALLTS